MPLSHYSSVPLKHLLIIIIFYTYVSKCNSENIISETQSALEFIKLSNLEDFLSLPKNVVLTAQEISRNRDLYLEGQKNEDVHLNGTELIKKYGYQVEEHRVITSDLYNLGLYRIPGNGRIVFLMHGLFNSFVDWLTVGPDQGLPYILASQGYDVWLGNARGNTFSRKNERLSPNDPKFWDFSFNEIGSIDLAAMIDYVLEKTGKKKLTYIGYSQGTTSFFVLCSTRPEYNDKIEIMIALSAVAWMEHLTSPILRIVSPTSGIVFPLAKALGLNEVLPDKDLITALTRNFCGGPFPASLFCQKLLFLLVGFDYSQIHYKQLPVIFSHFPAGASIKQLQHYSQLVGTKYFRNFDYGLIENSKKYGSVSPPSYPVDKISVPTAIFYSPGDWLANPIDVDFLRKKLQNVVDYYEIPYSSFNHLDFLWAKDVKKLVYDRVLNIIKKN